MQAQPAIMKKTAGPLRRFPRGGEETMELYSEVFDAFVVFAGIYMLYGAATGKGSLFKTDRVKKGMEEKYLRFMRGFCLVGGLLGLATGALDYLKLAPYSMIVFVTFGVFVVSGMVVIARFTDRAG